MQNGQGLLILNIYALLIILVTSIVFFKKERLNQIEDKTYSKFLIINILVSISGLILGIMVESPANTNELLIMFFNKIYLICLLLWITILTYYTMYIAFYANNKKVTKLTKIYSVLTLINIIMICILPISITIKENVIASGLAIYYTYSIFAIGFVVQLICILIDYKNMKSKKYIPFYSLIFLGVVTLAIQVFFPNLNYIINPALILIAFIMYHTIENPDVKMINELNIAKLEAERASSAKTEFLANMSHEIRTPLNAITGFSQALAEEEGMPESAKEDINDIILASNSLLEIVNGVLDISKIEANKIEIVNKTYRPIEIFKELESLTKVRIGQKPIELRTSFDATIPDQLYGDHTRIKQIILNLLTNAAKYTEKGYIDFKVSSVIKEDVCRLIISVEDTGKGIKNDQIDRLFTKFDRLDEEENITIEGTGLGLAITKKLLELMNGKIVVQSIYGQGSKFTAYIDQKIVKQEKENKVVTEPEILMDEEDNDYRNKNVLVVDDNKLNLKVTEKLLKKYNINVTLLQSGFDTIEKINSGATYDLILMDDMMPQMSGKETLIKLRENKSFNIPTIALTANALTGMREEYLKIGFNDYLAKPIEKIELERVLKKFLSK